MAKPKLVRQEITGEVQPSDLEITIRQEIEQRRERIDREAKCDEALQKVLDEHNCNLATYFNGGQGNLIPVPQIIVLPVVLKSASR